VCFLSGNITLVVFLAGKPMRLQVEWVPHECHFLYIICHYYEYFEAFLVRIVVNLIQDPKFGLDVTLMGSMTRFRHNVTPTGAMTSLRHVIRRSNNTHDVTEVSRCQSQCTRVIQQCNPEKYCTVGLHAWQWQKLGRNVRIKLFSEYEIGFNDVQSIDHQII
jgi:hypothetical protein